MSVFNWYNASIKQKIGGLFVFLLTFLFCVIVFSAYKVNQIEREMRVVAFLDIPLSQLMQQVEFIELEQHLQFEQFQLKNKIDDKPLNPHQQFAFEKQKIKQLLDKAVAMINHSLALKEVILQPEAHQKVATTIENYTQKSDEFENYLENVYQQNQLTEQARLQVETMATELESAEKQIIAQLNKLTSDDAYYTDQHEKDFLFVSSLLGICAIILGLLLTTFIIQIILRRIQRIQSNIETLNSSVEHHELPLELQKKIKTKDELAALEHDIKIVISRLNQEMTSREEIEKQLIILATQDRLTGVFNRHKWEEQIENQINMAARSEYLFALIILDIDHFKQVNDQYGHQIGDKLLKHLATQLQPQIRTMDMLFRIGGEEFAIISPTQDKQQAHQLAERLRMYISELDEVSLPKVTASFGVTCYQADDSSSVIFNRADKALYEAKAQGRNCIVVA
ncbi:GGDEF domain-containing protein [Pseudoalteromonas sp. SR44-5]|uniref:GGDEF domain-containing protein n=1 Tax=Pseudoalteromonas TaxID=53246 RepID=UPI001603EA24|nr:MULTISPECIES: GGDEF domain-containing protein [unclassified Pseudoalteromonas]MBB1367810.1 GGDEF domain-containing protein [Pseudoalteromonas sp. SR44-5]MBB1469948.1 GGDEF domain-containing protein [Pseudoalteromonas sp. SG41-5]